MCRSLLSHVTRKVDLPARLEDLSLSPDMIYYEIHFSFGGRIGACDSLVLRDVEAFMIRTDLCMHPNYS